MTSDIVVDVGNTNIKWGRCCQESVAELAVVSAEAEESWENQLQAWNIHKGLNWVVAGVHPARRDKLVGWLEDKGHFVHVLDLPKHLPLHVKLEHPERAGMDRLLNAVAANSRRKENYPVAIVDAGSAVTIDYVDPSGAFCGGAIFPGLRLMARALNQYTALLPIIEPVRWPSPLGKNTLEAMAAGIYHAVLGGICKLLDSYHHSDPAIEIYITGGDGSLLREDLASQFKIEFWPKMTLEGIRLSVRSWGEELLQTCHA